MVCCPDLLLVTSTTQGGADVTGGRTYTVANVASQRLPVHVAIRVTRDEGGAIEACVEIPHNYVFNAVVLAGASPSEGMPSPGSAYTDSNRGAGVVFPGEFAWLMFVAPDGTTYGSAEDGSNRIPLGHYAGTFDPGDPGPKDAAKLTRYETAVQGLQPWTTVSVTTAYNVDTNGQIALDDHLYFWSIQSP